MSDNMYLFLIANIVILLGTLENMIELFKNRKVLNGYSTSGAILTFVGIFLMQLAIIYNSNWLFTLPSYPVLLFWGMVIVYNTSESDIYV